MDTVNIINIIDLPYDILINWLFLLSVLSKIDRRSLASTCRIMYQVYELAKKKFQLNRNWSISQYDALLFHHENVKKVNIYDDIISDRSLFPQIDWKRECYVLCGVRLGLNTNYYPLSSVSLDDVLFEFADLPQVIICDEKYEKIFRIQLTPSIHLLNVQIYDFINGDLIDICSLLTNKILLTFNMMKFNRKNILNNCEYLPKFEVKKRKKYLFLVDLTKKFINEFKQQSNDVIIETCIDF